jgi:fumarate hydratase subunit alpha
MAVTYELIKSVTAQLYSSSLRKIPEDTKQALQSAEASDTQVLARKTIRVMLESATAAQEQGHFVCSDAGIPVYVVKVGTRVQFEGNIKQAISDGFDELVRTSVPPLLQHVTNPLTLERGHKGKDVPIVTFDLIDGADYVEITCSPKALGSGRWAALEIFSFPTLDVIEEYILKVVLRAGSQPCPPVVIGIGIGGTFDYAAKLAKDAMLRSFGKSNADPLVARMEARLLRAVNATGFGPMGTGGDTTAMAVHIEYAAGHGFTPIAVEFNCWINRRTRARVFNSGVVEFFE